MNDKLQAETSERAASTDAPLSLTAVFLVVSGVVLLLAAMASKQWLEARPGYSDRSELPVAAGLFSSAASSGAQFVAMVCMGVTALLALLGLAWRILLPLSLGFAMVAGAAASYWILDERTWQVGRAYPFAMFALLVLIMGIAQASSAPASPGPRSKGNFIDGRKHGRWYVYDADGQCVTMEDWDHGTLVSATPVGRS